jgi:hypothetical protein
VATVDAWFGSLFNTAKKEAGIADKDLHFHDAARQRPSFMLRTYFPRDR